MEDRGGMLRAPGHKKKLKRLYNWDSQEQPGGQTPQWSTCWPRDPEASSEG